jgi:hypothetical protein
MLADAAGTVRVLSGGWSSLAGIAWSPGGKEVWFSATKEGPFYPQSLHAVTLAGRERTLLRLAHSIVLADVSRDGRALVLYESRRVETRGRLKGHDAERDLSWFDRTTAKLAPDGETLVFGEDGEAGGLLGATYIRRPGSAPPVRLSEGLPLAISPDGAWVVCRITRPEGRTELRLVPTGPGEPRPLALGPIEPFQAWFLPDGGGLVLHGALRGRPSQLFVLDLRRGAPRPLVPEGWTGGVPTPDGRYVTARGPGRSLPVLYPLHGGDPKPLPGIEPTDVIVEFTPDGQAALVREGGGRLGRLDLRTGRRTFLVDLKAPDSTGVVREVDPRAAYVHPSGRYYTYTFDRVASDLYLIEGLR